MNEFIKIEPRDNVIIMLETIQIGEIIELATGSFAAKEEILRGHKMAIRPIGISEPIIKYGEVIGVAREAIEVGAHVHIHNVETTLGEVSGYSYQQEKKELLISLPERTVKVYPRINGDVGIRNELWIVPTVGCVNAVARQIKNRFLSEIGLLEIDGVHVFTHDYGCSQMGQDHVNTRTALQGIAKHPNAGGVLVLGLGCENNQVEFFEKTMGAYDGERTKFMIAQEVEDEVSEGVAILKMLYKEMLKDKRVEKPINVLNIGLECGGSDGFSGITANPLLGEFSDYLVEYGGTSVLTEVPEMFGAEHILMKRCISEEVFQKTVALINDFKHYYKKHDQVIYDNPSPGNKRGGITTLEEKSLGCIQKAGRSAVMDVLQYGEIIKAKGVNLVSAPGNDLVATTALGISGCHMVIFTTGRGTPYGGFIPTVKVSTNSELAQRKKHWIDFDAGQLITGINMDSLLIRFIDYIIEVCNGKEVNNEKNDFREIAIFKSGVTL